MRRKPGALTKNIMAMALVPLLSFGLIVLLFTSEVIYSSLKAQVSHSLEVLARSSYQLFSNLYPGGYSEEDGQLFKGGVSLAKRTYLLDNIRDISEADATLFLHDVRFLTTLRNPDGTRAVGTHAAPEVAQTVLVRGQDYFSDHIDLNGTTYFGYYMPLRTFDGGIVGMLFVGLPRSGVMAEIRRNILLVSITELLIMAAAVVVVSLYGRRVVCALEKTEQFLGKIASGDLTAQPDPLLLERQDEIGEMGRFAVVLRDSISGMVGRDPLTGLYNRRCCDVVLQSLACDCCRKETAFTVAMGDIDFFKRINDTYGHQSGDEVLRSIAGEIAARMEHIGFVFRWGGEEFLIVYENMDRSAALEHLERLRSDLSAQGVQLNGVRIPVTMTFGVAEHGEERDVEKLIQLADSNLYRGKRTGRDRVVCSPVPAAWEA